MFAPSSRTNVLTLTLAAACWGVGTVVSKRAIEEIPPLTLLPIQLGVSLAVLAILMRWRGLPFRDPSASPVLGRLGILNPGMAYALSLLGLVSITASLSVMIWAIEPLIILLLAGWFLRERVGSSLVVLSLVALGGLVLVIGQPGGGSLVGVLLTIAGVVCCASYTVVTRRWLVTAYSTTQVIVAQQAHAIAFALVLVAAAWLLGGGPWPVGVTAAGWASAIVSGILYYALAYWFYLSGLRNVPASLAAVSFYLIPIFGVAGASVLLGEHLDASQWVGVVIVLAAVLLITRRTTAADPATIDRPVVSARA
ncbi:MAG TPA: DMT family transporter [Candidatus Limnocylindrales bacterium]|jgi:probable blue pigment (indigoidine) exporter|nr:DMT family transporter [Candidatus Limnocylindrales bacterium]